MLKFRSAEGVFEIEDDILLFIQEYIRNEPLDAVMKFITSLGDKGILWISIAIIMMIGKNHRKTGIKISAAMSIGLLITNFTTKNAVRRPRPFDVLEEIQTLIPPPTDWSFPSGHTTSSIAAGILLLKYAPKKIGIPAFTTGILISLSRMYVGVHYPSDVAVGAVAGLAAAFLADKAVDNLYSAASRRKERLK